MRPMIILLCIYLRALPVHLKIIEEIPEPEEVTPSQDEEVIPPEAPENPEAPEKPEAPEEEEKTANLDLKILEIDQSNSNILGTFALVNKGSDSAVVAPLKSKLVIEVKDSDGVVLKSIYYPGYDAPSIEIPPGGADAVVAELNPDKDLEPGDYEVEASYSDEGMEEVSDSSSFEVDGEFSPSETFKKFTDGANKYGMEMVQHLVDASDGGTVMFGTMVSVINDAMAMKGANTVTHDEIRNSLNFNDIDEDDVCDVIESLHEEHLNYMAPGFTLSLDNGAWPNQELTDIFLDSYRNALDTYWKCPWIWSDYSDPVEMARIIDEWIQKKTNGLIKDLIREEDLCEDTAIVLATASYAKTEWNVEFTNDDIVTGTFYSSSEKSDSGKPAEFLSLTGYYPGLQYAELDNAQVCQIPFKSSGTDGSKDLALTVIIPREGNDVQTVVGQMLTIDKRKTWQTSFETMKWDEFKVDLRIPIIEARNPDRLDLKPILRDQMGWTTAFDKDLADFTRMHERYGPNGEEVKMWIEYVYHDAVMNLTKEGCEAAAAQDNFSPKEIYIDQPFACMIEQPSTDLILFAGVVGPDAIK